jgi:hypothetical protein
MPHEPDALDEQVDKVDRKASRHGAKFPFYQKMTKDLSDEDAKILRGKMIDEGISADLKRWDKEYDEKQISDAKMIAETGMLKRGDTLDKFVKEFNPAPAIKQFNIKRYGYLQ